MFVCPRSLIQLEMQSVITPNRVRYIQAARSAAEAVEQRACKTQAPSWANTPTETNRQRIYISPLLEILLTSSATLSQQLLRSGQPLRHSHAVRALDCASGAETTANAPGLAGQLLKALPGQRELPVAVRI